MKSRAKAAETDPGSSASSGTRRVIGAVVCDNTSGVFVVLSRTQESNEVRGLSEQEAFQAVGVIRGSFLRDGPAGPGFLDLLRGKLSFRLKPLLTRFGKRLVKELGPFPPGTGLPRYVRFTIHSTERNVGTFIHSLPLCLSDDALRTALQGNGYVVKHGPEFLRASLTKDIGSGNIVRVEPTGLDLPHRFKDVPTLEEGRLPPLPRDGKVRRLDSGRLGEYVDGLDKDLAELYAPILLKVQSFLNDLKGEACPTVDANRQLAWLTGELAKKYGVVLLLPLRDEKGNETLWPVRLSCEAKKGSPAGEFRAEALERQGEVLYAGPLWPPLLAGWEFKHPQLFSRTRYTREEMQKELDELAGKRLATARENHDTVSRLNAALKASKLRLYYNGLPVSVWHYVSPHSDPGKGNTVGSVALRTQDEKRRSVYSDPTWPGLEVRLREGKKAR